MWDNSRIPWEEGNMSKVCKLLLLLFVAAWVLPLSANATNIDFEIPGAPCDFNQTSPLTDFYQSDGVLFSGPGPNLGGAVLNQCSSFGINAHSGTDFLAFNNVTYGVGPEKVAFSSPQSTVSIWAGDGLEQVNVFVLAAYDSGNNLLGEQVVNNVEGQWQQLSVSANNISYVTLGYAGQYAVWDDLSFTSVPEPGSLILLGSGILGLAARLRKLL
jgi:hypothetical protein